MKTITGKLGVLFLILIVITNVSALDVLKPATLDKNYTILQTCASCTYVNITVSNTVGIVESNVEMSDNGSGVWIYTLVPTILSRYDVTGQGNLDGTDTSFATFFLVTPSGKVATTGDSLLYALFSFIFFGMICILSFFIIAIPSKNEEDDKGFETKILRLKYLRVLLIFLLYPLVLLLFNFLNGLAVNFSALSMFSGILGFAFETMLRLSWPFTFLIITWIVVMLIHDTNLNRQLDKFNKFSI